MNFDLIPRIFFYLSGGAYLAGVSLSVVLGSAQFAAGFAAGGALVLVNLWISGRRVRKADFNRKGQTMASLIGGFYARLLFLGACLGVLIGVVKVDAIGLVTGLSVVPAGLLIMLALILISNRRPEEV
jgi:hypothetical protein